MGAVAVLFIARKVQIRLQLSRAKHRSLAGHSKWSRRIARLVPFYEYGEAEFFSADDAPAAVVSQRALHDAAKAGRRGLRQVRRFCGMMTLHVISARLWRGCKHLAMNRPIVRLRTRANDGPWRSAIPSGARREGDEYVFELPEDGPEPLLKALIDGGAGIETLAI